MLLLVVVVLVVVVVVMVVVPASFPFCFGRVDLFSVESLRWLGSFSLRAN